MTLTRDQMLSDLASLDEVDKIKLSIVLAEKTWHVLVELIEDEDWFETYKASAEQGLSNVRKWLGGQRFEINELIYPVYNADGTDIQDVEPLEGESPHSFDVIAFGSALTEALMRAGNLQWNRDGRPRPGMPLDWPDWDEYLADEYARHFGNAGPEIKKTFEAAWKEHFGRL